MMRITNICSNNNIPFHYLCILDSCLDRPDTLATLVLGKPHVGDQLGGVVLIQITLLAVL